MAKDMTSGNPMKLISRFTLPLLIGNVFQQFYNMADTYFVGRYIGVQALAAVGSTGSIVFFIIGFAISMTAGLAIPLAQKFGAKDMQGVKRSFYVSTLISIGASIVLTTFSMLFCRQILELMQTPPEIIDYAYEYLMVIFAGIFAQIAFNLLSNIIRAIGDAITPLYFLVLSCILNIFLDYVFIVHFNMGVGGSGFATVVSQLFSAICCYIYIKKKIPILHIERESLQFTKDFLWHHINISFPMGFQSSIIAIGTITVQIVLNRLGHEAVAGYTAAQKIDQLGILPMMSFGITMATYSAQNYGAKLYDRIWKGVRDCIKLSLTFSFCVGFILILFSQHFMRMFVGVGHESVVEYGRLYILANSSSYAILSLLFIYRYTLQGVGKTVIPTIAGMMELMMRVFAALVLTKAFGYIGLTTANPLAWFGSLVPLAITYYAFKRKYQRYS